LYFIDNHPVRFCLSALLKKEENKKKSKFLSLWERLGEGVLEL
jgi:hypothetical protein